MTDRPTPSGGAPLRVAWLLDRFPAVSETFLLRQITGLIERGCVVDLYARRRGDEGVTHDAITRYGLMARVTYPPEVPRNYVLRVYVAIKHAARHGARGAGLLWLTCGRERFGRRGLSLRPFFEALPWLDAPRHDVVVASYGTLGEAAAQYRRLGLCDAPLVTMFRGFDATRVLRREPRVYDELFATGAVFLAVSEDLRDELRRAGCPADRLRVLRGGVELAESAGVPPPTRAPGEPTRFFSACRLVEKKGLGDAVSALSHLAAQGHAFTYDIAGDGPLRLALRARIEAAGLADRVRLVGWRDRSNVRTMLEQCHLVLCPSVTPADGNREGVPNIIKEAMACRRPVIATRHGGIPEAVADGVSGRLVNERDVDGLASALRDMMDHAERWAAMAEAGRARAEAMFDGERLNDELLEVLRGVVARGEPTVGGRGLRG